MPTVLRGIVSVGVFVEPRKSSTNPEDSTQGHKKDQS
jgi:hypothetical protein